MRRPGRRQRTCANNKHMTATMQCRPRALIALILLLLPAASECADFNASFTEVSLSSDYLKSGTHVLALGESILNDTTAVVHVCSAQSALLDPKSKDLSPDTSDCEYIFRLWLPVILAIVLGAVLLAPCLCAHDTTSAASVWGLQSRVELSLLPPCRNHPFTEGCYVCGSKSARYDCFHSFHSSMSCKLPFIHDIDSFHPCHGRMQIFLCMQTHHMHATHVFAFDQPLHKTQTRARLQHLVRASIFFGICS